MYQAFAGALALALTIVVLKLLLPEVANDLIILIVKVLQILIRAVDQASANLPK
jgi:hypothetical protein